MNTDKKRRRKFPKPDSNLVYSERGAEKIFHIRKNCIAQILVLETEFGWVVGGGYQHAQGSHAGSRVGLRSFGDVYPSREAAIRHMAKSIADRQRSIIDDNSSVVTEPQKLEAKLLLEWTKQFTTEANT